MVTPGDRKIVVPRPGRGFAPPGVSARYAAFDVTPARYVSAIITDREICRPPYGESLRRAAARR